MPTFEQLYAYERKKWNKGVNAQRTAPEQKEAVERVVETEKPDYSKMTRSDLFKACKAEGWDKPWVESTVDAMVAYLA